MYKWDPAEAAVLIEAEQITGFIAPAAMTGDLVLKQCSNRDLHRCRRRRRRAPST